MVSGNGLTWNPHELDLYALHSDDPCYVDHRGLMLRVFTKKKNVRNADVYVYVGGPDLCTKAFNLLSCPIDIN